MTGLSRTLARTAAAAVVTLGLVGRADAAIISVDNASPQNVPGLTGFITNGATMAGLSVTAHFKNGLVETRSWGTTGIESGGVTGTNWGLSLVGDSFLSSWSFANNGAGELTRLILDGSTGLTLFDKREPDFGTEGSFSGLDFTSTLSGDASLLATYRNPVGLNGAGPVGDLFQILDINFAGLQNQGTRESFTFIQDTDTDNRFSVPEPSLLALFGLGLVGSIRARRRVRG